jgi:hypothetical protein
MEDKYYTPDISEFYEGFEWEQYLSGSNKEYQKMIFTLKDVNFIVNCYLKSLQDGWIRVKYLDKEDIESEGFIFVINDGGWEYFSRYPKQLSYYKDRPTEIEISNGESYDERETYFQGIIKNKSELKRILKMIGV